MKKAVKRSTKLTLRFRVVRGSWLSVSNLLYVIIFIIEIF